MKTKTNTLLIVGALIAYWIGLCNASAFYDPGAQRWVNRDPVSEEGFELLREKKPANMRDSNLYVFVNNSPANYLDYLGLKIKDYEPILDTLDAALGAAGDLSGVLRLLGNSCFSINLFAGYVESKHNQCMMDSLGDFKAMDKCDADYKKRTDAIDKMKCLAGCNE